MRTSAIKVLYCYRIVAGIVTFLIMLFSSQSGATVYEIEIGNFYFSPQKTVVQPGDTVRWTSVQGTHTSTSENSSSKQWDSGILGSNETFEVVFTADDGPGPFPYLCSVHPTSMKDTIFMAMPADSVVYYVRLNGANANQCQGNDTDNWGYAVVALSPDSTRLHLHLEHTIAEPIQGHIHFAPKCEIGFQVFGIVDPVSPVDTTYEIDELELAELLNGQYYLVVHTEAFVAGEIRGQIDDSILVCADPSADGAVSVGDAVYLINYIFRGGLPPIPLWTGDVNCDEAVNVGDAVYLIGFIFRSGPAPCCPQS